MAWLDILVSYLKVFGMLIIPVTLFVYLEYDLRKDHKKYDKEEDEDKETENREEKL